MRKASLVSLSLVLAACSTPPAPSSDAATDAPATCTATTDCDDGLFCNGHEQCMPGSAGANRLGCVAGTPTCLTGQSCNEAADTCTTICAATSDADGDTHDAMACGGDDCDDSDPHRFPGNTEVCDASAHDEDCNLDTYGMRDADADGYGDAMCCNHDTSGVHVCGNDCNDMRATQHPGAPEVCNGVDDDCNGVLDGPSEDSDHDGHANSLCAGVGGSDCNDRYPDVYFGAPELCDGIDSDCSSCDAATQLCTGPGCATPETRCGDPRSDTSEDGDGDAHAPTAATCMGGFPTDDCDDAHAAAHPGGAEICDGIDDDCNGTVDDAATTNPLCAAPGSDARCARGGSACVIRSCSGSLVDCDGDASNGCETDLATSIDHCGACGASCGAAGTCTNHVCDRVTAIATAPRRGCALRESGRVACWGSNGFGLLNDGTRFDQSTPVEFMTDGSPVAVMALGPYSWCMVRTNGGVDCSDGAFLPAGSGVRGVALAEGANCAFITGGAVRCYGQNDNFELGDGTTNAADASAPVTPTGLSSGVTGLAAGAQGFCARMSDGTVRCWGNVPNASGAPLAVPTVVAGITDAVEISGGLLSFCVRRAAGQVVCWGDDGYGQLGDGANDYQRSPVAVQLPAGRSATLISQGGEQACAILDDGSTVCWGANSYGQLGDGTLIDRNVPTFVLGLNDAVEIHVPHLATGPSGQTTCARRSSGAVVCWGRGEAGELGDGTADMFRMQPETEVFLRTAVPDVGGLTTCARMSDGTARCWGVNNVGEVGDGTTEWTRVPHTVMGVHDVSRVTAATAAGTGDTHACALHIDGRVGCWGYDQHGELGDGGPTPHDLEVFAPGITDAIDVQLGGYFTCVLRASGHVTCWGRNDAGQLGDGTTLDRTTLADVVGIMNAVELSVGEAHACARLADGGLRCWGANDSAQLGDGTMTSRSTAVDVSGLVDTVSVRASGQFTCAIRADRTVVCWGRNNTGQLGDGTRTRRTTPTAVVGVTSVVELALRSGSGAGRRADGSVVTWGGAGAGPIQPPAPVSGLVDVTRLAARGGDICALRANGSLVCWGSNFGGQLGDGTAYDRTSPVRVIGL